MRIDYPQLASRLKRELAPVYLLYGDEPLQLTEAADAIRRACRRHGIGERRVFSVLPGFDWNDLAAETEALSLFASSRLLDVRVPEGKVGQEGARVLGRYSDAPPPDTILLLVLENAPPAAMRAKWFQKLERIGLAVQTRTLHGRDLLAWLERRAAACGLRLSGDALQLLALRTEGNLLAAAQEIDKLHVLCGETTIEAEDLARMVADSARFDVFDLTEAWLAGQPGRCDRILSTLRAEGTVPAVVLWSVTREIRTLLALQDDRRRGLPVAESCRRLGIWARRRPRLEAACQRLAPALLHRALRLAARIDACIKGQAAGDSWEGLRDLCLILASGEIPITISEASEP
ncbi:DNA polymerase III subunit delta [Methylomarinovum tepidoasis]|uniref:DNA polymerase III subunit delta n=1 Tax=Methylomarinovum tepidoasis TaxID=2840183 RepID=A0AAU9CV16_9GAMM|nr:DNA polymerase III subunit delta [Methylomarinovum sp. IN45]BCX87929.1 DNA polymerase III subunit delta [Methylomarinovum sp. IN45]